MKKERIIIIGAGVAGINAATKLLDNNYPGELITIIDRGKDPYTRPHDEVMLGYAGAGLNSDGKYCYLHNIIGGQLAKYCGEDKADELVKEGLDIILRFHPDPSKVMLSNPIEEPEFIKPYFQLRMAPTYHIGTNYLNIIGKRWYDWQLKKGVNFIWDTKVTDIDFESQTVTYNTEIPYKTTKNQSIKYDTLIYGTGKSGIDLTQYLIEKYNLKRESKSVQLGVRMELPQKYMQSIIDISYDYKLYQKPNDKVSLRSFCSNSNAAYIAEEDTYGMKSYNGHSFKQEDMTNNMTNFGIIMEIKDIKNPFDFQKQIVNKCQINGKGIHYSPFKTRKPSLTGEGYPLNLIEIDSLDIFKDAFGEYAEYIINYINDLDKVFKFGNDYSLYIPEVKFLSEEVLVNYNDLSLVDFPNVHFVGDSLSARGIAVSAAHGIFSTSTIIADFLL